MLGLRTTIYKVSDMEKAKKWYTKVFQIAPYFDEPFYVGFNIAGYERGLQPEKEPIPLGGTKIESVISYWGVNEIEKEYQRFIALGATG